MNTIEKIAIFVIVGGSITIGALLGTNYQQIEDAANVQKIAIDHNCGAYDARTGEFGWVTAQTAQSVVLEERTIMQAVEPPKPQRKPRIGGAK